MTSKERVKCAHAHQQPDKIPIDFSGVTGLMDDGLKEAIETDAVHEFNGER